MSNFTSPWTEPKRLVSLKMTCSACPSQWEGELEDGNWIYARYRHGYLSIETGPTAEEAVCGELIFAAEIGDQYDGDMGTQEMLEHAQAVLTRAFPPATVGVDRTNPWQDGELSLEDMG